MKAVRDDISLRDIAKAAGVSVCTVSKSLKGHKTIGPEVSAQIRKLAADMGYRPKPFRTRKTGNVGLLVGSTLATAPDEQYLHQIIWVFALKVAERGLHFHLQFVSRDEAADELPSTVEQNLVDGVVLIGHPPVSLVENLAERECPAVALYDTIERLNIPCVICDFRPAMRDVVLRLAAWGHKKIGLLISDSVFPAVQLRRDGYEMGLRDAALPLDKSLILTSLPATFAGGRMAVSEYLERGELPTAILAINDWMAAGILFELNRRGISSPGRVSVVGVGSEHRNFPNELEPTLSSIVVPETSMIDKALDLLLDRMEHRDGAPRQEYVFGNPVWRNSTCPIASPVAVNVS